MDAPYVAPNALGHSYSSATTDELLAIVSFDAHEYEEAALGLAREELITRGIDGERLRDQVRDLKARRFDEMREESLSGGAPLASWMFWVCMIETGAITACIFVYLAVKGRGAAAQRALTAILLGVCIKAMAFGILNALVARIDWPT
jgi:hypothetical protein